MVALVTGGGRGIGQQIALRLAQDGWDVAVAARSADQLADTVARAGGKTIAVAADVSHPASVRSLVREVEQKLGPVALLVNNAGVIGPLAPFWESDPEDWWRCLEVNVRGPMLCCREIVPGMMARKAGRIINMVSGAGNRAIPGAGAYVESKTALIRFSEQLAAELEPHGIRVFPMAPGIVRTAMLDAVRQRIPAVQKFVDDGIDVTPDVAADLALFLASGQADSLSGRLFSVGDNVEEMVRRGDQVRSGDLYVLRAKPL
jgi:NAD(P)-dependent dehydrogenase (short-subunit alcohol dehydrogenase family)